MIRRAPMGSASSGGDQPEGASGARARGTISPLASRLIAHGRGPAPGGWVAAARSAARGAAAGIIALSFAWGAATGAFYEWGGAAARGVKELREKRNKEAAASLRKGREELPRSAAVRYDEALALSRAGLGDSARQVYRQAIESRELRGDAARSSAAYNLGNEALAAGRLAEAARFYRESLRIDPTRVDAKRNLEEVIRRGRRTPPPRAAGAAGGTGGAPPAPGSGAKPPPGQGQPPPEDAKGAKNPERPDERIGGDIPNRADAEHWLQALEAERKAARLRDRREQREDPNAKDW